jgi:2-oxo-3-hexenedioate decarboxylase
MEQRIEIFSTLLDDAARQANPTAQLSAVSRIFLNDAYRIQKESISKRCARGEKLTGIKMGFTSLAKMEQMGVHDMIWGRLTDSMEIINGEEVSLDRFIHPRAEPEIAFLLKKDINNPIEIEQVLDYIEGVAPAIEIIDSRYKNFKFSLEDVIADNCSSSGYVVGKWQASDFDISNIEISIGANGEVKQLGNSKAILGNPFQSLVEAARLALKYDQKLKKGMIVLAGAATPAIEINRGDSIEATFGTLGKLKFSTK